MENYKKQGELVFIDFTAKWCFTCKVNEKLVLETEGFKALTLKYKVKLLMGDWTKRDEVIGNFLRSQGLVGVPAYFVINKKGELIFLGETISLKKIEEKLILK
jgi:thiol:disulfide interchange protein